MTRKRSNIILTATLALALAVFLSAAARTAARAAESGEEQNTAIAAKAPPVTTGIALPAAVPEEIADLIDRRYSGISTYKTTFTVWRPQPGKRLDEEKLKGHWNFEKKRIEKYVLWYRDGIATSSADGTAAGKLTDYIRLRGIRGPLKGTEVFYDPSIEEPRATVVRGKKVMRLNSDDPRLKDILRTDARAFAADIAAKLRDPELKRKLQHKSEGGDIIITTKALPLYKNTKSRTITTRWTVTLAPDGSLKKMIHEEKLVTPPGILDAIKSALKALVGARHVRPKPKFNIRYIYTWGGREENPPLPEGHFVYNQPKEGESGGR
ncbi:MAG: hypothetical protein ABIH66_07030 [bacterium]